VRVEIEFDDERGMRGTLTLRPSWIGRLFGRRTRVARVFLSDQTRDWHFAYDGEWVGSDLEARIKQERRWRTVSELPPAHALEPSKTL